MEKGHGRNRYKGGTYNVLGGQLARILERLPGKPIERVKAEQSLGSIENIHRLINSKADVALVQGPALVQAARENSEIRQGVRVLARLYTDIAQVVVRKNSGIETLTDLKNRRIYIGAPSSGTRMLAIHILESAGLSDGDYTVDDAKSYAEAAEKLINEKLDAAIYTAGIPTEAVRKALESGAGKLLSLDSHTRQKLTKSDLDFGLVETQISANYYQKQPERIQTVGADVFLVCPNNLSEDLAYVILEALFENIDDLLLAHTVAQDIKLTRVFNIPEELTLHPGAIKFQSEEQSALLIATGAIKGKYYNMGRMIRMLLKENGIRARVIHTDGSLENAELLNRRPTLAIMQYDAALASRFGQPRLVYHVNLSNQLSIPTVGNIHRIASLHQEKVHVLIRRDKLASIEKKLKEKNLKQNPHTITTLSELAEAERILSSNEENLRVCLGARNSATQVVAQVILKHHGIELASTIPSFLSVSDMVSRLQSGEIDMGFFVSYVPSGAMKAILNDDTIKLLSLGAKERVPMTGAVFAASMIEPGTYGSQKKGEPAIQTIATRAVLVTTEDLPANVEKITRTIFKGAAYLGIDGDPKKMAEPLPSLPLHPGAKEYYQKAGLLPAPPHPFDWLFVWLTATWRTLAIMVMLVAGYKGTIMLKRDRTANEIGRRIFAISTEATEQGSATKLSEIRQEIQDRVRRRWWFPGELDKPRWQFLRDIIDARIEEAKGKLMLALVAEIRATAQANVKEGVAAQVLFNALTLRVWDFFERGELDASQHGLLLKLIQERGAQQAEVQIPQTVKSETERLVEEPLERDTEEHQDDQHTHISENLDE